MGLFKSVHGVALRKLAVETPAPLRDHISAHRAAGTDLTHAVWAEFFAAQRTLLAFRTRKAAAEWAAIKSGDFGVNMATISVRDVLRTVRTGIRLMAVYMLCVMWGRDSLMPLLDPKSPFLPSIAFENPNFLPNHTERLHEDAHE